MQSAFGDLRDGDGVLVRRLFKRVGMLVQRFHMRRRIDLSRDWLCSIRLPPLTALDTIVRVRAFSADDATLAHESADTVGISPL